MSDLKYETTGDLFKSLKTLKEQIKSGNLSKEELYAYEVEVCWLERELDYRNVTEATS